MALLFPDYEPRHKGLTKAMEPLQNLSKGRAGCSKLFSHPNSEKDFCEIIYQQINF